MIKNEAHVIQETLQPFVDAGIDSFFIFDTGSTDDTINVVKTFFEKNGIKNALIKQEQFIDFSTSRNCALNYAEEAFKDACFMLMPDAEWYMHNVPDLVQFCMLHKDDMDPVYLVRIVDSSLDFYTARLIRCHSNVRFSGTVHETINYVTEQKIPPHIFFELKASKYGKEKTHQRWIRDCKILRNEYKRNPHDPRTTFYLAQTYACLGDLENAKAYYKKRIALPGWGEENYMTQYRLALIYEDLNNWDKALHYYFSAISLRPHRAEPFVRIAEHYWNAGNKALCFLFARYAAELPYPQSDILFIEKELYDFTRYDLLGRVAWYMGEYALGEKAVRKALQIYPQLQYLNTNLTFYVNRKKNKRP